METNAKTLVSQLLKFGFTELEIANAINVHKSTVNKIKTGITKNATLKTIKKLNNLVASTQLKNYI